KGKQIAASVCLFVRKQRLFIRLASPAAPRSGARTCHAVVSIFTRTVTCTVASAAAIIRGGHHNIIVIKQNYFGIRLCILQFFHCKLFSFLLWFVAHITIVKKLYSLFEFLTLLNSYSYKYTNLSI